MLKKIALELSRIRGHLTGQRSSSSKYYQLLHDVSRPYQENNWLIGQQILLDSIAGNEVCEIGCGNGMFLKVAAELASKAIGIDWARSPALDNLPSHVSFIQASVLETDLPKVDVICSGDVLEHFRESDLHVLVKKMLDAANRNFHVIACYDDNHSHLTIQPPAWWHELFEKTSGLPFDMQAVDRGNGKIVAVIHNLDH